MYSPKHDYDSKIRIPAVPKTFLKRRDLLQALEMENKKLVILNAAAGYGKTILFAQFAENLGHKCAWYHLDSIDNDPIVFMQHLCKSLKRIFKDFIFDFNIYSSIEEDNEQIRLMIYDFIGTLYKFIEDDDIYIILDDFHEITNEAMHSFINIMIKSAPGNIHFFVACRGAVPIFCARYIMDNTAVLISQEQLKFNLDETRIAINNLISRDELEETAVNIYSQVEGWPVGVMACFLYLERMGVKNNKIPLMSRETAVHDYIMFEVFRTLPYDLQIFLTRTSMLEFLSKDICNHIMNIDNSDHILRYLEQQNLFTLRIEASGSTYRYHALFREFLQSNLSLQDKSEILKSEVSFYMLKNDFEQAVEYAIDGDYPELMQCAFESIGMTMLEQNKLTTMERWISYLEHCNAMLTPNVILICGIFYIRTGNLERASQCINECLGLFLSSMDEKGYILASIQKAHILRDAASFEESNKVLDGLLTYLNSRKSHVRISNSYPVVEEKLYNLVLISKYHEALELCRNTVTDARTIGNLTLETRFMRIYSVILFHLGEYAQALEVYNEYPMDQANSVTEGELFSVETYISIIKLMQGELSGGKQLINNEIEAKLHTGNTGNLWLSYSVQASFNVFDALNQQNSEKDRLSNKSAMEKSMQMAEKYSVLSRNNQLMHKSTKMIYSIYLLILSHESKNPEEIMAMEQVTDFAKSMGLMFYSYQSFIKGDFDNAEKLASICIESSFTENIFTAVSKAILVLLYLEKNDKDKARIYIFDFISFSSKNKIICPFIFVDTFKPFLSIAESAGIEPEFVSYLRGCQIISDECISVKCFGDFEVCLPGEQEPVKWRTKKARELFAYLIHLKGMGIDKEKLLTLLWPDSSPSQSTDILHTTLYNIRKMMASYNFKDVVEYKNRKYKIDKSLVKTDLDVFNELCNAYMKNDKKALAANKDALKAYSGNYMTNIDCDWVLEQREYYEKMYIKLCEYFGASAVKECNYEDAIMYFDNAVKADPYDENLYIKLMKCYHNMGNTGKVHSQYTKIVQLLKNDLDAVPGYETTMAYYQLIEIDKNAVAEAYNV